MEKVYTEDQLKDFVRELRKQENDIWDKEIWLSEHNFNLEAKSKNNEREIVRRIIHKFENEFDLGFVSSNDS